MNAPLHLVQMRLDPAALMRFAASQRLDLNRDEDGGYALHAWLAAMFGGDAPKPFRWFESKGELLGYARRDHYVLAEHAQAFAAPIAHAVLRPGSLQSKTMPERWMTGRRLSVAVLACPVSRNGKTEKDVYLRELDDKGDAARPREVVYLDWFRRQWGDAVAFERLDLTGFDRGRSLRRGRANDFTAGSGIPGDRLHSRAGHAATGIDRPRLTRTARDGLETGRIAVEDIEKTNCDGRCRLLVLTAHLAG